MENSRASFALQIDATNPSAYRVRQATAQIALGDTRTKYAAELKARLNLRELITAAASATGTSVPKELADPNLEKQLKEALDGAEVDYTSAEYTLAGVTASARSYVGDLEKLTVRSAWIAQIFAQWAHSQQALLAGNAEKARDLDQRAQESVKSAAL